MGAMLSRSLGHAAAVTARCRPAGTNMAAATASRASSSSTVTLPGDSNQALGIANYAKDFVDGKYGDNIDDHTWLRIEQFHTDSVMTGISALALKTNAPTILRDEALSYPDPNGGTVFGSTARCSPEK